MKQLLFFFLTIHNLIFLYDLNIHSFFYYVIIFLKIQLECSKYLNVIFNRDKFLMRFIILCVVFFFLLTELIRRSKNSIPSQTTVSISTTLNSSTPMKNREPVRNVDINPLEKYCPALKII